MVNEKDISNVRVFLIEDDEDDYVLTRDLLSDIPGRTFEITWLASFDDAIRTISRPGVSCDICLVDYRLGRHTGLDLLCAARETGFEAPIILLTGQGDAQVDIAAMQAGAADYLVKGQIDTALLDRAIRYAISQRHNQQQQLQLIRMRAERAEAEAANRAKDEVLAIVSHELRAPLNAILGWARILQTKQLDEKTLAHAIETIERSARMQSKLIDDLLDSARVTTSKLRVEPRPIELNSVVQSAVEVMRPAAQAKSIDLNVELTNASSIVFGDPERLQQVVWNLLSNAIKFTPPGGRVAVTLERVDPHLQITVTDTGIGIKLEFLPMVFDRFFTQAAGPNKRRYSGLGLGLALAKHIVELHGGAIEVESDGRDAGAKFTVRLPLPATGSNQAAMSSAAVPQPIAGLRILVVDDQPEAREMLAMLLEQYGVHPIAAASAREALAALQSMTSAGEMPDLIISDIGMPDEDGYELARQLRTLPPDRGGRIPAVALTAFSQPGDRLRAIAAGFQRHLSKPVDPDELSAVIASLAARAEDIR